MKRLLLINLILYATALTAQSNPDTATYFFIGKLTAKNVGTQNRGIHGSAAGIGNEYEVVETNYLGYHHQYVTIIHLDAQLPATDFFVKGKRYKMMVARDKDTAFVFEIYNQYAKRRSPFFLSTKTERYRK